MRRWIGMGIGLLMCGVSYAKTLGVHGQTYPIAEQDLLVFIQSRLQSLQDSGEIEQHQKQMQARVTASVDRPPPVTGLAKTQSARTFLFDPSITISRDIPQANAKKGTRFNPLSRISLSKTLIFYDGDDPQQVAWVQKTDNALSGKTLLILVKGSVSTHAKQMNVPIYFDQQGKLTQRFNITHIPATVKQKGQMLEVSEVKL